MNLNGLSIDLALPLYRAYNNTEVIRRRAFSSAKPVSDAETETKPLHDRKKAKKDSEDESDDGNAVLKSLLTSMKSRSLTRDKIEADKLKTEQEALELAKRREEREARLAEERWEAEKQARIREEKRKAQAVKVEEESSKRETWDQVMKMIDHSNPIIRARGKQMAKKLAEEEGILIEDI